MEYIVTAVTGPFGELAKNPETVHSPELAITKWCKLQYGYPTCVAIQPATKEDGMELLKWADANFDKIKKLMEENKCPYKTSYMKEQIKEQVDKNKCSMQWEYDQIFPFCMG